MNEESAFLDLLQVQVSHGPWMVAWSWIVMLLEYGRINRHNSYPPQSQALWMRWQTKGAQELQSALHVVANGKTSSFYGWVVFHCVCIPCLLHSFIINGHLGFFFFFFLIFVIINNAVVNTKVYISFWNMVLERIMLSEISQMKKDKHCTISLICGI